MWRWWLFGGLAMALTAAAVCGAQAQPTARPPGPDLAGSPSSEHEWFLAPQDAALELWSATTPTVPKKVARYFVGDVTVSCQSPSGATYQAGAYKVAVDEYPGSPRLQISPNGPFLYLASPVKGRTSLVFAKQQGPNISCLVRASKPYGVDNANAPTDLADFRFGR